MNLNIDHKKTNKLLIEKYFTGELDEAKSIVVQKHVKNCTACNQYYRELAEENTRFLNVHPFHSLIKPQVSNEHSTPWYKQIITCSLQPVLRPVYALIIIIGIILPFYISYSPSDISRGIRNKGTEQLSFLFRRDGKVYEGTEKDTLQALDEIQIIYNSSNKQYISLFSIDSKGTISFYLAENTSQWCSIKTEEGPNIYYPSGIVLDNSPGHELVVALFTKDRIKVKEVQHWISDLTKGKTVNPRELEKELYINPLKREVKIVSLLLNKR